MENAFARSGVEKVRRPKEKIAGLGVSIEDFIFETNRVIKMTGPYFIHHPASLHASHPEVVGVGHMGHGPTSREVRMTCPGREKANFPSGVNKGVKMADLGWGGRQLQGRQEGVLEPRKAK